MSFVQSGSKFFPAQPQSILINPLPVGFYRVSFNPNDGHYLEITDGFSVPERIYGDVDGRVQKVMRTYTSRSASTGVLLTGTKGGGKTMLAKRVCLEAIKIGHPVIICDKGSNIASPGFAKLLQVIDFPFVGFFDEFEKNFDRVADQSALLSLMDGLANSQRLLLLTCNERRMVSPYMLDRPGRIFYLFSYDKLDEDVLREFCADKGVSDQDVNDILTYAMIYQTLSFDILMSVVEEMGRFGCSFRDAIKDMNVGVDNESGSWEICLVHEGQAYSPKRPVITEFSLDSSNSGYLNSRSLGVDESDYPQEVKDLIKENVDDDGDLRWDYDPNGEDTRFDPQQKGFFFTATSGLTFMLRQIKPKPRSFF